MHFFARCRFTCEQRVDSHLLASLLEAETVVAAGMLATTHIIRKLETVTGGRQSLNDLPAFSSKVFKGFRALRILDCSGSHTSYNTQMCRRTAKRVAEHRRKLHSRALRLYAVSADCRHFAAAVAVDFKRWETSPLADKAYRRHASCYADWGEGKPPRR